MARKVSPGVEERVMNAISKFRFNTRLPLFIDMAKYLESTLRKGEFLVIEYHHHEDGADSVCVYVKKWGRQEEVSTMSLDSDGCMNYRIDVHNAYEKYVAEGGRRV